MEPDLPKKPSHPLLAPEFLSAYNALKSGVGWRRLDARLMVRVTGDDRISFLHGMCTADVKAMSAGQVASALFVTERAHVIAELYIYAFPDALLLEVERDTWPTIQAHLEKFLVADDVELEELDSLKLLAIAGPASATWLAAQRIGPRPGAWRTESSGRLRLASIPRVGVPSVSLIAEAAELEPINAAVAAEMPEICAAALEIVRIENGIARIGVDTNEKTLALEARLEPAISLNKGCYVGQETLERATARGGVKRRLYGLRLAADRAIAPGAAITLEGKPVGVLTSTAYSPEFGPIGLSIIHHSAWAEGTTVILSAGEQTIAAEIADLPFRAR